MGLNPTPYLFIKHMNKLQKLLKISVLAIVATITFSSCKEPLIEPISTVSNELVGTLTTQTLNPSIKYVIKGVVVVPEGVVLTIPAGTVLAGQKSSKGTLLIKVGGQLIAEGTESKPIVFTSNQNIGEREQGDWGGIVMLGKANVNQNNPAIEGISPAANYGTFNSSVNDGDNSGILKYVRIEYAGIALTPNNETNGLTLGGVGNNTTIDYVQTTYGGDDGFEWFGGTVNCSHLISFTSWDDDFDTDFGYGGKVQFAVSVRDPYNADQSGSNGFESDNDASGTSSTPKTSAVFSNVTVLGPVYDSTKSTFSGNYQHAMHLRRNTELSILNSVISGYPLGLNLDGTLNNYTSGSGVLENNILVCTGVKGKSPRPFYNGTSTDVNVTNYWKLTNKIFTYSKSFADVGINPELVMGYNTTTGASGNYPKDPNFSTFSLLTQTGADFSNNKVKSWFQPTTYKGAFGNVDWTDIWSSFNPQNQSY
jgi:hypothetical protein